MKAIYVEPLNKFMSPKDISENTLLSMIALCAERLDYYWFHEYDSRRRNVPSRIPNGFPDLVLVGVHDIVFAELKAQGRRKNLSDAQKRWKQRLTRLNDSTYYYVWVPSDWEDIQDALAEHST